VRPNQRPEIESKDEIEIKHAYRVMATLTPEKYKVYRNRIHSYSGSKFACPFFTSQFQIFLF